MILKSQRSTDFFFQWTWFEATKDFQENVLLLLSEKNHSRNLSSLSDSSDLQAVYLRSHGLMDKVLVATLLAKVWTEQHPKVTPSTQVLGEIISQISKLKSIKNYIQLPQQVWGSGMATFFKERPQAAGHFGFRSFVILRISFLLLLRLRPLGYWVGNFCLAGYKRRYL